MFPSHLVAEAVNLAANAAERGIAINGHPNSFLDNLVGLSKNAVDTHFGSMDAAGTRHDRSYMFGDVNDATHAAFTDDSVRNCASVVSNCLQAARSDALPLIKAVMESFQQVINPDIPYAYRKRAVVPVAFHPVWSSEYVQDIASAYHDGLNAGAVPAGLILSADEEQFSDFLAMTKTGLPQIDAMLADLVSKYDVSALKELFVQTFTHGMIATVQGPASLAEGDWINDQILIHVWARNLVEMTPEKSAHPLTAYKTGIATVVARSGHNIWNINKVRQNCAEGKVLVLAYRGDAVYVHSDIYTTWLKEGGSPEVLLGASLMSGQVRPASTVELSAVAGALVEKWNSYVSMTSRSEQENLNAAARIELFKVIRACVDERKAANLVASYEDSMLRLNDLIGLLPTNFIKNPYPFIRDIVLKTFYCNTDVPLFVMAMDEVVCAEEDPSDQHDEEEVATIAVINYTTDWMCKLLSVKQSAKDIRLIEHNTAVTCNAVNVVALTLGEVLGKVVQRKLGGSTLTDEALAGLITARLKNRLAI